MKKSFWKFITIVIIWLIIALLWFVGLELSKRITNSNINWSYVSCDLTGKEKSIVNCDERVSNFTLSGNEVSFMSPEGFSAIYVPFDQTKKITLQIDPQTNALYSFFAFYSTFWWKELQAISGEDFSDMSISDREKSLPGKQNNNFFFEKDENWLKTLIIDPQKPILTQQHTDHHPLIKNTSLIQAKNPKGIIVLMYNADRSHTTLIKQIDAD